MTDATRLELAAELAGHLDLSGRPAVGGLIEDLRAGRVPDDPAGALDLDPAVYSAILRLADALLVELPVAADPLSTGMAGLLDAVREIRREDRERPFGELRSFLPPTRRYTRPPAGGEGSGLASDVETALARPENRLGRYVLIEPVGGGGMGIVHRAWDSSLARYVAVKLLRDPGGPMKVELRERFLREGRAAARLRHPGIVAVHDVGEEDGRLYLTMDYVEGATLDQRLAASSALKAGGNPAAFGALAEEVELVARIAEAVGHAHGQGIVHRDVKPSNVLLDRDGNPFVTDFGLAKDLGDSRGAAPDTLTLTGAVLGTPGYMSPEQAGGECDVGPPSDVFGLGVILYEVSTGRQPFEGATVASIVGAILAADPVEPRRIHPRLPRDLETICLRSLEKDPARRYPDAGALAADLRRHLAGEPIEARPISPVRRLARRLRRHPRLTAGVVFLVALVGGGLAIRGHQESIFRRRLAERAAFAALATDVDGAWRAGNEERRDLLRAELEDRAAALLAEQPDGEVHLVRGRLRLAAGDLDGAAADFERAIESLDEGDGRPLAWRGRLAVRRYLDGLEATRRRLADPARAAQAGRDELEGLDPSLRAWRLAATSDFERVGRGRSGGADASLTAAYLAFLAADWAAVEEAAAATLGQRVDGEAYWLAALAALEQGILRARHLENQPALAEVEAGALFARAIASAAAATSVHRGLAEGWLAEARARAEAIALARHRVVDEIADGSRPLEDADRLEAEIERALRCAEQAAACGASPLRVGRVTGDLAWAFGEVVRKVNFYRLQAAGEQGIRDVRGRLEPFIARLEALDRRDTDHLVLYRLGQLHECLAISGFDESADHRAQLRRAIDYHGRALAREPAFFPALFWRGNAGWALARQEVELGGDPIPVLEAAVADYSAFLEVQPDHEWARLYRGICHFMAGEAGRRAGRTGEASFRAALVDLDGLALDEAYCPRAYSRTFVTAADLAAGRDVGDAVSRIVDDFRRDESLRKASDLPLTVIEARALVHLAGAKEASGLEATGDLLLAVERFRAGAESHLWVLLLEIHALVELGRIDDALAAAITWRERPDVVDACYEGAAAIPSVVALVDHLEATPSLDERAQLALELAGLAVRIASDGRAAEMRDLAFRALAIAREDGVEWGAIETEPELYPLRDDSRWGR